MLGDLVASADPDPVVAQDVIDETGERRRARRLAGETAMQRMAGFGHDEPFKMRSGTAKEGREQPVKGRRENS